MIKVKNGIASREHIPEFLQNLNASSLEDLTWTDPNLGVQDCAWWPEVDTSATLSEDQIYGAETLTLDVGQKVVIVFRPVLPRNDPDGLKNLKAALMDAIDEAVALRISKATRFAIGYQERETAAQVFKDAGYIGDPTEWVSRFASNTGMTNQAAADLILSQAVGLRSALAELDGKLRMDKYLVAAQTTFTGARAKAQEILAAVQAVIVP